MMEDHYTARQAADRLHCSEKTVNKYIRTGQLKAVTGVRPRLISASSLQAFLDSMEADDLDEGTA